MTNIEVDPATGPAEASIVAARTAPVPQLPALTGLRFFAAVLVVLCHFGADRMAPGPLQTASYRGFVGVDFFFLLSGFILTYTYTYGGGPGVRGSIRAFYVARFARIYPLYLVGLLLGLGPLLWLPTPSYMHPNRLGILASTLTLTQAWFPYWHYLWDGPGWSLSAEAIFYALFPTLLPLLARRQGSTICLVMACCYAMMLAIPAVYFRTLPDAGSPAPLGYWWEVASYNPIVRLPEFVFGMALGKLFLTLRARPAIPPLVGVLSLAAFAVIACALADPAPIRGLYFANGLLAPLFGVLILTLAYGRGPLAWLLGCKPMLVLGEASYALYLLHFPVWQWMARLCGGRSGLGYFAVYLLATTLLAILAYRLVEVPARKRLRRALEGRRSPRLLLSSNGAVLASPPSQ